MDNFECFVDGVPVPQGSKSVTRTGRMYEANKKLPAWRRTVTLTTRAALNRSRTTTLEGPLVVRLEFVMPRPKAMPKKAALFRPVKPDVDKLTRAVFDALTDAEVWRDDGQVVDLAATKRTAMPGEEPGVRISAEALAAEREAMRARIAGRTQPEKVKA